ncbi:hypothetical protein [Pseudodesulfovibrio senegalensis]|uniref:Uncharacterized protein n=1 Tax=Pseudodesulfovibrio senegalensis TaxID=1721087 RepID=A0A6N6MXM1_9BACT|nr:hypothetical protein [Pseudodesulfovibrio senegalensis]KAB1437325.1 hypothetical protein F8A88_15475 [Pseudodesulfovibrio senegalensis]
MKKIIFIIVFLFLPVLGFAQQHPLAETDSGGTYPLAEPKKQQEKQCREILTCEFRGTNGDAFSNGDLWNKPLKCSNCSGKVYEGPLKKIIPFYEIIDFETSPGVIRLLLKLKH